MYIANPGRPADICIALAGSFSAGSDTVSKRIKKIIISLIVSLDRIICANAIPSDGTVS
jgi:hypothetical protein